MGEFVGRVTSPGRLAFDALKRWLGRVKASIITVPIARCAHLCMPVKIRVNSGQVLDSPSTNGSLNQILVRRIIYTEWHTISRST